MTSVAVDISDRLRDGERSAHVLNSWRAIADTIPAKTRQEHTAPGVVATVVHHGVLQSSGFAALPDGSAMLAIVGAYWLSPDAEQLARPEQALQLLLSEASKPNGRRLYGNYSFVLVESACRRVTAECGGFGVVPLYYLQSSDRLSIASDLKFLLPLHRPALSREGAAEFLIYGHLISELTLLEGVKRLLPSTRLVFENDRIRLESSPLTIFTRDKLPSTDTFDLLDSQFERAIRRYQPDVGRVSVSLSGGLDSRTTLLAAQKVGMDLSPWTAGEPGSRECMVAKMVCDREGLPLTTHENDGCRMADWFDRVVWYSEARCPPGHMHFFDAGFSGAIAKGGQLHGLIGDVVVGGDYDTDRVVPTEAAALRQFCVQSMQSLIYWPEGSRERLGLKNWISAANTKDRVESGVMERSQTDDPYSTFLWSRYQHRGFGFIVPALSSQVAPWGDMMTPFIDPAFFATCASMSRSAIRDRRAQLTWAARRYPSITDTPRVKDGVLLPLRPDSAGDYDQAIKWFRRVMQFRYYVSRLTAGRINLSQRESYPFYGLWYRNCQNLRAYFSSVLLSEQSLSRGLWNRAGIEHLLNDLRVGRNVWDAIGSVLMLEVFARLFVDQAGTAGGNLSVTRK